MSTGPKSSNPFFQGWPFAAANPMMNPENWLKGPGGKAVEAQEELRDIMSSWSKRYQEGIEASIRSFQAMCSANDPGSAIAAYQAWLTGNVNRLTADFAAMQADMQRLMALSGLRPADGHGESHVKPVPANKSK